MKKLISLLVVIALCVGAVCVLTACGGETPAQPSSAPTEPSAAPTEAAESTTDATELHTESTEDPNELPLVPGLLGGWQINTDDVEVDMPEEAKEAFDAAMAARSEGMLDGDNYTPIAYLGSQVVSGTNYAYLCRTEVTDFTLVSSLKLVTVYRGLVSDASVLDVLNVNIEDYTDDVGLEFEPMLAGGWTPNKDYPAKLSEEEQAAFDAATAELAGVSYTPLALMGTQLVAGRNLAFLCCAESATEEPMYLLAVIVVYADLDGDYTITSLSPFYIG